MDKHHCLTSYLPQQKNKVAKTLFATLNINILATHPTRASSAGVVVLNISFVEQ